MNITQRTTYRIGLISDTHGLLRPAAVSYLHGSDFIVHAGDIGDPEIIRQLAAIAPVTAVRGNNDRGMWAEKIPEDNVLDIGSTVLYVLHDLAQLSIDPAAAGFRIVVAGHSHRPSQETRNGVLYLNPGSAGPRRFRLPISVGSVHVTRDAVLPELVELPDGRGST
ncbi:MAG: metallophosphoesterase family protein [Burkholderiales bacterium]